MSSAPTRDDSSEHPEICVMCHARRPSIYRITNTVLRIKRRKHYCCLHHKKRLLSVVYSHTLAAVFTQLIQ